MAFPNLRSRFYDPGCVEEMDRPDVVPDVLKRDLENLRTLNRCFGGLGAARFACRLAQSLPAPVMSVLDAACGGGDLTKLQHDILAPRRSVAIDLHPTTLELAREHAADPTIDFQSADLRALPFPDESFDLVTCHLALHHFPDDEAVTVLRELARIARRLVVVSDLERNPMGYAGVWLVVRYWLNDPITRHDALLSVRRAWNRGEFAALAHRAGWKSAQHRPLPWFRQALWWHKA
ncbi:MAG: methyltransferase domain-containing protein [Candidatus Methylacidiphilales bacterium]|nr:methyltransferase domain-containing protein [Candidatus Methylacidiphilales bacterium]